MPRSQRHWLLDFVAASRQARRHRAIIAAAGVRIAAGAAARLGGIKPGLLLRPAMTLATIITLSPGRPKCSCCSALAGDAACNPSTAAAVNAAIRNLALPFMPASPSSMPRTVKPAPMRDSHIFQRGRGRRVYKVYATTLWAQSIHGVLQLSIPTNCIRATVLPFSRRLQANVLRRRGGSAR